MAKKVGYVNTGRKRLSADMVPFDYETGFTQVYDILTDALPKLSFCTNGILLFIWLCVRATGDYKSGIRIAKDVITDFNDYLEQHGRKRMSKPQFYRHLTELCEKKLFIKVDRGFYYFNAEYVWRGSVTQRLSFLRMALADRLNVPLIED